MPGLLARSYSTAEIVTLVLLACLVVIVVIMAVQALRRSRVPAEEQERRRRRMLVARGKMGDANLLDVRDQIVYYSYDVRGIEYTATQDVSALTDLSNSDLSSAIGPVYVKYDATNPANSIILAEDWSGLRTAHPQAPQA